MRTSNGTTSSPRRRRTRPSTRRRSALALGPVALLGLVGVVGIVGCAATNGDTTDATDASAQSSESEQRASCTNPQVYFATYADGTQGCQPIAGSHGQWVPQPLFADAPVDVQASTCAYRWVSAPGEASSVPDRDAITAKINWTDGLAPSCGTSATPGVGDVQPIPEVVEPPSIGSAGCDVCGVLRNSKVYVVLPPDRIQVRQFQVVLSSGATRAFQIAPTVARALSLQLPPAPQGTTYVAGHVKIL